MKKKIDDYSDLIDEDLNDFEINPKYDEIVYTSTNKFLENILEFEYLLEQKDLNNDLRIKVVKKYLKEIYHYRRYLVHKTEELKKEKNVLINLI